MSTSKNSTKETKSESPSAVPGVRTPPAFIHYALSDSELSEAQAFASEVRDITLTVQQFVSEGYKFSTSFDKYGGRVQFFIPPAVPENVNAGFTLSSRAPNLTAAVGVLAFKHYSLFQEVWPLIPNQPQGKSWG